MQKNLKLNAGFIANLCFQLTSIVGMFLMSPIMLKNYGKDVFIIWSIVNSICALLFIVDFGITSIAAREILKSVQTPNLFSWKSWKNFIIFHTKLIAFFSIFLSFIFIVHLSYQNKSGTNFQNLLIFIFTLIGTIAVILSHQQIIKFQILNKYSKVLLILAFIKIFETVVFLVLLMNSFNFIFIVFLINTIHLLQLFVLRHISNNSLPRRNSDQKIVTVMRFHGLTYISNILYSASTSLGIHATFILQSLMLNPSEILVILFSRMMVSPIRILSDALATGNFDKFIRSSLQIAPTIRKTSRPMVGLFKILVLFASGYLLLLIFAGSFLMDLISYGESNLNLALLILFGAATLLDGAIVIYMQASISNGTQGSKGTLYFSLTLLSLFLLIFLVEILGIYGGVLSILLCDIIFFVFIAFSKLFRFQF